MEFIANFIHVNKICNLLNSLSSNANLFSNFFLCPSPEIGKVVGISEGQDVNFTDFGKIHDKLQKMFNSTDFGKIKQEIEVFLGQGVEFFSVFIHLNKTACHLQRI